MDSASEQPNFAPATKPRHSRAWKGWLFSISAVVVATLAAWALSATGPLQQLELKLRDQTMIWAGPHTPPDDIVIVAMDDATEQAIPAPRILWHPYYAALMRALARGGAKAAGFDILLAISVEQWAPDYDRQLAEAFAESSATSPLVMAYETGAGIPEQLPLYMLARLQQQLGYANVTLDADGFVRRQQLISNEGTAQGLTARLAALSSAQEWNSADLSVGAASELKLGDRVIPVDAERAVTIAYYGPAGTFPRISMIDVLRAAEANDDATLRRMFEGKTALVGTLESSDHQPTPFYRFGAEPQQTPGVEIHANVLAALQQGRFLRHMPRELTVLLMLLLAALGATLARWSESQRRLWFGLAGLVALVAAYLLISALSLRAGYILPGVPVLLASTLSAGATYAAASLKEGKQRRLLQEVFGRYVSDSVAEELLNYGDIPLGGKRQLVSVMFTDLRNFTNYSEGRDPEELVAELNEYFSGMSAAIKAHNGMINKFIGDGIMALWGAPVEHMDDARRAVACGLAMVASDHAFNERRAAQGKPPLRVGIGIHTGMAMVGNIGAPEKMEYTAMGDTVNRASRIESANKQYGTQLLISETTYHLVSDLVEARCVGNAEMKGVAEAIALYEVTALK